MIFTDPAHERTIHGLLARRVRENGAREFFHFQNQVFSYADLDRQSHHVAAGLQALGAGKGDKIAIIMGNRPEFLFTWFGLCKLGGIEVPINVFHRGAMLKYMLEQSDTRFVVIEAGFLGQLAEVLPELPRVERLIVLDEPGEIPSALKVPLTAYCDLIANDGRFTAPDVVWSDPFCISFTSGTTGPSKGALMPHNYAVFMAEMIMNFAEYTEADCLYNALPLFHGNAQFLSTMPALYSGARMVLAERFSAGAFWPEVRKYGCTAFNYIGIILPILLKAEPRPDDKDHPLRILVGGGCPPDIYDLLENRFGVTIVEGYGLSELGLPLANNIRVRKKGTIGRVMAGYQVKVVDDQGLEVKPGAAGELLVRVDKPFSMMLEYYRMPRETVETWRDLWFHTGDFVTADEDGYYRFVDRKKDALRRRGENISSYEVEKIINAHPAVAQSAAIAAKSDLAEDEVMVCVVLKPWEKLTPEALLDYCQAHMAYFMVPRYVRFMASLPQTPTLRVQKALLRQDGITADTWDREKAGYQVRR